MTDKNINMFFHKDNTDTAFSLTHVTFPSYTLGHHHGDTLPIEVLQIFRAYPHVVIKSMRSASLNDGVYINITGNRDGQGIDTSNYRDPKFWEFLIDVIKGTKGSTCISELLEEQYKPAEEVYTLNQILHLVNVIRGDLANQPKLVKQILNMVEKENLL